MSNNIQIAIPQDDIEAFCRRWHVQELALFGSVLHERFGPDSDIDVLVDFAPGVTHGFRQLTAMQDELEAIFGRSVDLIEKQAVQESPNYIRRREILSSAQVIHA